MKIASFDNGHIGVVSNDEITDVTDLSLVEPGTWPPIGMIKFISRYDRLKERIDEALRRRPRQMLDSVHLETPIQWPNKIVAFPANFQAHIEEQKSGTGLISTYKADGQGFFLKANSSLSGPLDPIVLPALTDRQIHHECEIAIIIGAEGREIQRQDAMNHVFGYSCLIDVVVRGKEERVMRKSYDSFCPVGPFIVTADEIKDPANINLQLSVDGELRQSANTRDLIVDIPDMIRMASSVMTLYPGDIIASGTPAGVGPLRDGNNVHISVEGIGSMSLRVVQSPSGMHEVWKADKRFA